jgi:serine/threonine protein kinase
LFVSTEILGEGGFGKVLSTMFVKNGKWYATKEIRKIEAVKGPTGIAMLFGELTALKRLDHPFIINLHIAFQTR